MIWYLYLVALLFIFAGSFLILNTERARQLGQSFQEGGNYRLWGLVGGAFGLLLTISSFWSGVVWFLFVLGLVLCGIGIFMLVGQEERVEALMRVWGSMSERGLRLWGLIMVVTGIAILSWV